MRDAGQRAVDSALLRVSSLARNSQNIPRALPRRRRGVDGLLGRAPATQAMATTVEQNKLWKRIDGHRLNRTARITRALKTFRQAPLYPTHTAEHVSTHPF